MASGRSFLEQILGEDMANELFATRRSAKLVQRGKAKYWRFSTFGLIRYLLTGSTR
jgi:hypothetical protein